MKLAKLSLAAVIAVGAFSFANATPLENAIRGVDLSGMLRIRLYNENPKNYTGKSDTTAYNRWRTNGIFIFKVPVGDNFKMVYRASVESNVYTDDDTVGDNSSVDSNIQNNLLFMAYSNGPLNVIAGKIPVATSITSADPVTPGHGAGAIASYNVGGGFTVAGAYVDALDQGAGEDITGLGDIIGNTIYAAAAMYSNKMVKANMWYYRATNAIDYIYTLSANVTPMTGLTIHGDYATGKLAKNVAANRDTNSYYNLNVTYGTNGVTGMVGYAGTDKTASGKTRSVVTLAADAPVGCNLPTQQIDNIANENDIDAWYGELGYNIDAKTNVYVAYTNINQKSTANNDSDEYTLGASYKYNKKLSFSGYYDVLNYKLPNNADHDDNNELQLQAKYTF